MEEAKNETLSGKQDMKKNIYLKHFIEKENEENQREYEEKNEKEKEDDEWVLLTNESKNTKQDIDQKEVANFEIDAASTPTNAFESKSISKLKPNVEIGLNQTHEEATSDQILRANQSVEPSNVSVLYPDASTQTLSSKMLMLCTEDTNECDSSDKASHSPFIAADLLTTQSIATFSHVLVQNRAHYINTPLEDETLLSKIIDNQLDVKNDTNSNIFFGPTEEVVNIKTNKGLIKDTTNKDSNADHNQAMDINHNIDINIDTKLPKSTTQPFDTTYKADEGPGYEFENACRLSSIFSVLVISESQCIKNQSERLFGNGTSILECTWTLCNSGDKWPPGCYIKWTGGTLAPAPAPAPALASTFTPTSVLAPCSVSAFNPVVKGPKREKQKNTTINNNEFLCRLPELKSGKICRISVNFLINSLNGVAFFQCYSPSGFTCAFPSGFKQTWSANSVDRPFGQVMQIKPADIYKEKFPLYIRYLNSKQFAIFYIRSCTIKSVVSDDEQNMKIRNKYKNENGTSRSPYTSLEIEPRPALNTACSNSNTNIKEEVVCLEINDTTNEDLNTPTISLIDKENKRKDKKEGVEQNFVSCCSWFFGIFRLCAKYGSNAVNSIWRC